MLKAGQSYSDASGDMEISFLDVTTFEATVIEETETLEVVLQMRDIPPTATKRQIKNFVEYWCEVDVFLDPSKMAANGTGDYNLSLTTLIDDSATMVGEGVLTPMPGEPVVVAINELWDSKEIHNAEGKVVSTLDVVAEPDLDILTITGHVPGIKSISVFRFSTFYYDGTIDWPENYIPPESASEPEAIQTPSAPSTPLVGNDTTQLMAVGKVHAYPGPEHYAGDVLTFEIPVDRDFTESTDLVTLILDNGERKVVSGQMMTLDQLLLPLAFDTSGLIGPHQIRFSTMKGSIHETYSFEVLPASQRPKNEVNAFWLVHEIDCCRFHYISNTAAARDIKFISEQFQQAYREVLSITGGSIAAKLNVYLIDRIWGNGGFAGEDGLVISYTDRYYGPTIREKGLQVLARHELTHVTHLPGPAGDGIEFNYEGPAVYVAGGHYKPEPLAERGAALYDLGYYVPVGQQIQQHELNYLYAAAVLTYIAETYGSEKVWDFLTADVDPKDGHPTPLETAVQTTLGVSLKQFDQDFKTWLENKDPGKQLNDLRLTIELQDLRRQYQETYTPPPYFIALNVADTVGRPEYLPVLIREAHAPANGATELIIADAQQAIVDGDYDTADGLIRILDKVINTGNFEDPLAKDYLGAVQVLVDDGYDVVSLDIQGNQAAAQVTREPPSITTLELQKNNEIWQVTR